jgi:hypothetical protein
MFPSLPRLGSNLSTLIVQCGSAIVAATVEWLWLGSRLSWPQLACVSLTLTGVVLGMLPSGEARPRYGSWPAGVAGRMTWR